MRERGVPAQRITYRNLVLFEDLSAPVEPADLGAPARF